jgi:serine protease Do
MRGVNLRVFDFDYDLTWMAFFIRADETVYGRYGGRAPDSPNRYLSLAGLKHAMRVALAAHRRGAMRKANGKMQQGPTADQYPAAREFTAKACIHCHHVYDFRRQAWQAAGKWRLDRLWVYPLPENIGLTLEVDRGNHVQKVAPGSAADRLGARKGDRFLKVNGYRVASFGDIQYALHQAPPEGRIPVTWDRDGKTYLGNLAMPAGWRQTDISWRWSLRGLDPAPCVHGEDLEAAEKKQLGLADKRLALRQGNFVTQAARQAGIRQNDIIIGVDNKPLFMTARQFGAYVRLNYKVGDRITFHIIRNGQRLKVSMELPGRFNP